jgi:hypothetical protein
MTLTQARRYAVQKQTSIEFQTAQGLTCVIDEHGVARVPELKAAPEFVMTTEFDQAQQFTLIRAGQRKAITREQLSEMAGPVQAVAHGHDEDE